MVSQQVPITDTIGLDVEFGSESSFRADPAMRDAGAGAAPWTRQLPVSVNDTYGDPFIREQVANTVEKLSALRDHQAPIAIFTKAGHDPEVLARLADVARHPRVIVFYSLTGLDEGGIGFPERLRFIAEIKEVFPDTFVFTRPIIRRRNDDPATLRKLAGAAADLTGQLVLGGLHDAKKRKQLDLSVEQFLIEACDRLGVRTFFKTACAGAWTSGRPCWVHDLGEPRNLDVLASLGYRVTADGPVVRLPEGTTGDINFIRMVSGADVYVDRLLSNYNLLTMPTGVRKLEATSSWFAWSENIDTCLDCNYCIIKQIEYLKKMRVRIGVHPTRIPEVVAPGDVSEQLAAMRRTKLPVDAEQCHTYGDVRARKPCRIGLYARPRAAPEPFPSVNREGGELQ